MSAVPRLLFVHAHPDDESSKGAATAARAADEGAEVVLVTATDGAAGDILNPSYPSLEPHEMAPVRERELARAIEIIGFTRVHLLDYPDSGLPEDLADIPSGCFADIPVEESATRLAQVLREERPHVVVTYPPDGGYPHPDHIRVFHTTMAAVELAAADDGATPGWQVPRTVFGTGFPRTRLVAIHDALTSRDLESPYEGWLEDRSPRDADRDPDIVVDVGKWLDRRDAALLAHATQIDPDGRWFSVPREIEVEAFPWETYCVLAGQPAPEGATSLFDGLDLSA